MSEEFEAFMELYAGLPREGPGNADSLLSVLEMADTPVMGRIFDAACGSGADSGIMSRALPGAGIIGMDKQPQFIKAAKARGINADFMVGDMLEPDGLFDLIWCAGAVYFFGVEKVLEAWRKHLHPAGKIAFSEVVWLTGAPRPAAKEFWQEAYPQMDSLNGLMARIEACGFKLIAADPLGRSGWDEYYNALRRNIQNLRGQSPVMNGIMDGVIAETEAEMAIYEACFPDYDYAVFLLEPA